MPADASALSDLRDRLAAVQDLHHAANVLEWDQETHMPPGGAEARGRQIATLRRLAHEATVSDDAAAALHRAAEGLDGLGEPEPDDFDAVDWDRALVRVALRDHARATRIPAAHVAAEAEASARAKGAWKAARAADDFGAFGPHLAELVGLARERADLLAPLLKEERGKGYNPPPADARYDALLDGFEPGATTASVAAVFADLRRELVPLVRAVLDADAPEDAFLRRPYPEDAQWSFGLAAAEALGYDLARGRQDRSAHPFTTTFGPGDVRVTTRLDARFFPTAFFSTLHEAGHAVYEQGVAPQTHRTPLADGASLGVHESQSRLAENLVGRSAAYWAGRFADAKKAFPAALEGVSEPQFVRAVNRVRPSLIRVEADELTYHLHVLLRFELERALIAGDLEAADVPGAWNEKMEEYLGVRPRGDADGCLQDIHWSLGAFGYFPTYTLGTLMSVQMWNAMKADLADDGRDLDALVEAGDFAPVLAWLRAHVHRWGRARTAEQIVGGMSEEGLSATPWLAYARKKYARLYGLDVAAMLR